MTPQAKQAIQQIDNHLDKYIKLSDLEKLDLQLNKQLYYMLSSIRYTKNKQPSGGKLLGYGPSNIQAQINYIQRTKAKETPKNYKFINFLPRPLFPLQMGRAVDYKDFKLLK